MLEISSKEAPASESSSAVIPNKLISFWVLSESLLLFISEIISNITSSLFKIEPSSSVLL